MTKKLVLALLLFPLASLGQIIPGAAAIDAQVKKIQPASRREGDSTGPLFRGDLPRS